MVVLVFALLLTSSVATFTRRAMVDTAISRNRDYRAQADALARGGIELGKALLLEDSAASASEGIQLDSHKVGRFLNVHETRRIRVEAVDARSDHAVPTCIEQGRFVAQHRRIVGVLEPRFQILVDHLSPMRFDVEPELG